MSQAITAAPEITLGRTDYGLILQQVSFEYAGVRILEDVHLAIPAGQFVCLLGPSGCGKTTLLRLIAGLETPAAGAITSHGESVTGPSLERGVVFQDYSLFPWMSLRENVSLAIAKARPAMTQAERQIQAEEYLQLVGLQDAWRKYPGELSGGMQQRGAIARTLALGSPVLLMDEPFGALDPVNRVKLQDLLLAIWSGSERKKTVVFVTHDVEEAIYLGDRIIMLGAAPGRIIDDITVDFPRPRARHALLDSREFQALRGRVAAKFHEDLIRRLEAETAIHGVAEGI
jgi:NitT/TauT family transport system ATP-binding protein